MSRRRTAISALFLAAIYVPTATSQCAPYSVPRSLLTQVRSGTQESGPYKFAKHIHNKLIPDFGEVTPMFYRGAQPEKHGFEMLAEMGIQIVVDLRGDRKGERKEVTQLGMQYVPMHWQCPFPKDKVFADFITLIRANPGKKIFVHCRIGDDRTSMM